MHRRHLLACAPALAAATLTACASGATVTVASVLSDVSLVLNGAKAIVANLPGVTPASARSPLGVLMNRGRTTDGENKTAVQRAASALDARMSRHANDGE